MKYPLYFFADLLHGTMLKKGVPELLIDPVLSHRRVRRLRRASARACEDAQLAVVELGVEGAVNDGKVTRGQLAEMLNSPDTLLSLHQRVFCAPTMTRPWAALLEQVGSEPVLSTEEWMKNVMAAAAADSKPLAGSVVHVIPIESAERTKVDTAPTRRSFPGLRLPLAASLLLVVLSLGAAGRLYANLVRARRSMEEQRAE
ncbi:MAG: hypothetical protein ABSE84_12105, partial [Isosphaeraceae bacterium]